MRFGIKLAFQNKHFNLQLKFIGIVYHIKPFETISNYEGNQNKTMYNGFNYSCV